MKTNLFSILHKVQDDLRAGPAHVSLMAAILRLCEEQPGDDPIRVTGKKLRSMARISGKNTYHKYIADLHRFNYIDYCPSHSGKRGSRVRVLY